MQNKNTLNPSAVSLVKRDLLAINPEQAQSYLTGLGAATFKEGSR